MALADYHLCAVCGNKAFFDAHSSDHYFDMCDRDQVRALCGDCFSQYELKVIPRKRKDASA